MGEKSGASKTGVYLCRCDGNISYVIDVESIVDDVSEMDGTVC